MSEKEKKAPEVGKGSPKGMRWFVSKHPGLVVEIVAEKPRGEDGQRAPFVRVAFKSEKKSDLHVGDNFLGSRNKTGSDLNSNQHYGVYQIMDPGPAPFSDDGADVPEEQRKTAEEKKLDRKIIDHLRSIYAYRKSPQNNQYVVTAKLIELNWDPAEIRIAVEGMLIPGMNKPMSRPDLSKIQPPEEGSAPERPAARTPAMGVSRRVVPA